MMADSVSVPAPDFVSDVIGVDITSNTVTLPAPANAMADAVDAVNDVPEPGTSNVIVPEVLPTVAAAASVTVPDRELSFARFSNAPELEPEPEIVNGSAMDSPDPLTCTAAFVATVVF